MPWLSVSEYEFSLGAGASHTVQVTTDGDVPQPGVYTAGIDVTGGIAGSDPRVPVTMTVTPPATWGKLTGTVSSEDCSGGQDPLGGAAVDAEPVRFPASRWRMVTDSEGSYARWINTRLGTLDLTASAPKHYGDSARVTPPRGKVTVQDFSLVRTECEGPGPEPINPLVDRIFGHNRYGTAVEISQAYAPGVDTCLLYTSPSPRD